KTPKIRASSKGFNWPSRKKGNQDNKNPIANIIKVLLNTFLRNSDCGVCSNFRILKLIAFPTTNRNVGNTRSVKVNPCQEAWFKGLYTLPHEPGVFTIIIKNKVR